MDATDVEIAQLVAALDRERQQWIEGRFAPDSSGPMVQADDMTIFGPFGGELGAGGAEGAQRQRRVSALFDGGSGSCELIRAWSAGGLLVLAMIERNQVRFAGHDRSYSWVLRTTQVFRRSGEGWLRLHRHADPLLKRRSLDETLALID